MPAHKTIELHKASVLAALEPRRDPYWGPQIARGRYVGFRRIDGQRGSWIARYRNDEGRQKFKALGPHGRGFGFDQAKVAALEWFRAHEAGALVKAAPGSAITVADACRSYVEDRRAQSGEEAAHDAEMRFRRCVYESELGRRALRDVRLAHVKAWRDRLGLKPPSSNRTLTVLKAALNLAVKNRLIDAGHAIEWKVEVMPYSFKRRTLYLDKKQRRALLAAAGEGAFRDLLEAAALTGARPGEIVGAQVRQFDARSGSMTFIGKTRVKVEPRTVPIAPAAVALFKRRAKGRKADELLFTRDDGAAWSRSDWDQLVRGAATAAKLPAGVVLYTLRHSWITQAIQSGMNTLDAAKLSGTGLKMIEEHYGHLVAGAARARLGKLQIF